MAKREPVYPAIRRKGDDGKPAIVNALSGKPFRPVAQPKPRKRR